MTIVAKRPPTRIPKRAVRCTDCRNRIYAGALDAHSVNGRLVCRHCAEGYSWHAALQSWVRPLPKQGRDE